MPQAGGYTPGLRRPAPAIPTLALLAVATAAGCTVAPSELAVSAGSLIGASQLMLPPGASYVGRVPVDRYVLAHFTPDDPDQANTVRLGARGTDDDDGYTFESTTDHLTVRIGVAADRGGEVEITVTNPSEQIVGGTLVARSTTDPTPAYDPTMPYTAPTGADLGACDADAPWPNGASGTPDLERAPARLMARCDEVTEGRGVVNGNRAKLDVSAGHLCVAMVDRDAGIATVFGTLTIAGRDTTLRTWAPRDEAQAEVADDESLSYDASDGEGFWPGGGVHRDVLYRHWGDGLGSLMYQRWEGGRVYQPVEVDTQLDCTPL